MSCVNLRMHMHKSFIPVSITGMPAQFIINQLKVENQHIKAHQKSPFPLITLNKHSNFTAKINFIDHRTLTSSQNLGRNNACQKIRSLFKARHSLINYQKIVHVTV
jgi:hypothetical protein